MKEKNLITSTSVNGTIYSNQDGISNQFLISAHNNVHPEFLSVDKNPTITSPCFNSFTGPFTTEEIKAVVFFLGSDKSPDPDSFSLLLFQKYGDIVEKDMLD